MNREEIIELVIDALNLIGCKHTYVPAGQQRVLDYIVLDNPIGWYFNFWGCGVILYYQDTEGKAAMVGWDFAENNAELHLQVAMGMIELSTRRRLVVGSDELFASLRYEYTDQVGRKPSYAELHIVGPSINEYTTDKDLVPAARALLLGDCPEEVFLDLLCEKYDHINELRYAAV